MAIQLENLVESIKSKVRSLKKSKKKPYVRMDKSASVKSRSAAARPASSSIIRARQGRRSARQAQYFLIQFHFPVFSP
ncbi:unnamed protein product [Thlaspi arvense]|uniref:Uncharacterized protein n=1 Tax=Thlaspi arvense TaxID=13288 RepID=A0AAU9RX54_THLAR|nr:unnamed protein product [Thlaspi arvense]